MSVGSGSMYVIDTGECDAVVDPRIHDRMTERLRGDKPGEEGRHRSFTRDSENSSEYDPDGRKQSTASNDGRGHQSSIRSTRLFPGDSFNELTLLHAAPPPSTVSAATPVRLWAVDGATFRALINGTGSDLDVVRDDPPFFFKSYILSAPIIFFYSLSFFSFSLQYFYVTARFSPPSTPCAQGMAAFSPDSPWSQQL